MADALWTAAELNALFDADLAADWVATGVSIDSRDLKAGDLFIALSGPHHDGRAYIQDAFAAGASAAIVSRGEDAAVSPSSVSAPDNAAIIFVDDSFAALWRLATQARARCEGWLIAVTGSAGKTGVKESLRVALSSSGVTHASVKSFNNHIGVPISLARMPRHTDYAILEMGMNHSGELSELSALVRPDVAIVTTVNEAHIENFASVAEIARAKAEIFEGMTGGSAIIPIDNPHYDILFEAARRHQCEIVSFGEADDALVRLEKSRAHSSCSCVKANIRGQAITYKLAQPGDHHVINSLAVLAAVNVVEADLALAGLALAQSEALSGRGRRHLLHINSRRIQLIDESYNANPASMAAALKVLAADDEAGRRIAVLGDMAELGAAAAELHAGLGDLITASAIDRVYSCGSHMMNLHQALPADRRGAHCATPEALFKVLLNDLVDADTVMVKGSNASKMGLLVDDLVSADRPPSGDGQMAYGADGKAMSA